MTDARRHDGPGRIDRDECLRLLAVDDVGRLAIIAGHVPVIFPVNYALDGEDVIFRTDPGTKFEHGPRAPVCFEIDGLDRSGRRGRLATVWSSRSVNVPDVSCAIPCEIRRSSPATCSARGEGPLSIRGLSPLWDPMDTRDNASVLDRLVARAATLVTHTEPPRLFTELGRHPRLFHAWLPFGGTLLLRGELPRVDAELVILRTAHNCGCEYERVQHAALARRSGLSDAEVLGAGDHEPAPDWTPRQQLLLQAVDELHAGRIIDRETKLRLHRFLSERQVIELCLLVGHYEMLAMLLNTQGTQPDRAVTPQRRLRARRRHPASPDREAGTAAPDHVPVPS